jgi:hypothetical protein
MQMKAILAAVAALAVSPVAVASPFGTDAAFQRCGNGAPSAKQQALVASLKEQDGSFAPGARPISNITVPIHLHAAVSTTAKPGYLSKAKLTKQFEVMQAAYSPHGINFELKSITRDVGDKISVFSYTDSPDGGIGGSTPAIEKWWKKRRTGGYDELHLFFYETMGGGLLGICTFPDILAPIDGGPYYLDGCHVHGDSIPGGSLAPYDLGLTAVHEAGHWFGLFHVFQGSNNAGGCASDGDVIADTPAQLTPTTDCPADNTKDTCPKKPGFDSIHNFMDYSTDICLTEFTLGQEERMHNMYNALRKGVQG